MTLLSKRLVEGLKPKDKPYIGWDSALKGFGCKVHPTGRKVYLYKYRNIEKKVVWLTIGKHGLWTVDMARKKVNDFVSKMSDGIDPHVEKKQKETEAKQAIRFKDFWVIFDERYIQKNHKPKTIEKDRSRVRRYILPFFGSKVLSQITQDDILKFEESLSHFPGTLSRSLALLSKAFNQAAFWGYLPLNSNPTNGIKKLPSNKRANFLTEKEKERIEKLFDTYSATDEISQNILWGLQLVMYTGCREAEISKLKWEEVNLQDKYLYLKDEGFLSGRSMKNGSRTVPLNEKALNVLRNIKPKAENPYVLYGKKPGEPIYGIGNFWQRIKRKKEINLPDMWLHDFRHSFASFALKKGVDLYTVSKLLGHKNIATTTRYAHLELGALKEATNKIFE